MSVSGPTIEHRFADELPELAVDWQAQPTPEPRLLALDEGLASEMGLDADWLRSPAGVAFLTGGAPPEGARPVAQGYAGHQFGYYSPRLGDGRALLLGEVSTPEGSLRDIHLKGSGRTPFSRGGDGWAAVGPMLREHLVSAAMHALGVPTSRSLAVTATGRAVQRESVLPGAVLTRVASSHLRIGTFQYAAALVASEQAPPDLLRRLTGRAIARHHPAAADADRPALALLEAVARAQADLVAHWMSVGFVHGVLNTDNVLICGETIDYGPCAFVDAFDARAVFSSIDQSGRYAFGQQPRITAWNLARLAEALLPVIDDDQDTAVALATDVVEAFGATYDGAFTLRLTEKLGLRPSDEAGAVVRDLVALMQADAPDPTRLFRELAIVARGGSDAAGSRFADRSAYDRWRTAWLALDPDDRAMDAVNPVYIPRNHLVEAALDDATAGDLGRFERLLARVTAPYIPVAGFEAYEEAAPAEFGSYVTFCGT